LTFSFIIFLKKEYNKGYVYCITSPLLNAIKIGLWKGTIDNLLARYITPYGKNLELYIKRNKLFILTYFFFSYSVLLENEYSNQ
jgi:hypothetical protein